jgi:hypothetical protein
VRLDGGTLLLRDPEASDVAVQGLRIDAEVLRSPNVPMGCDEPKNLVGINGPEPAPPPSGPSRDIRGPQGSTYGAGAAAHLCSDRPHGHLITEVAPTQPLVIIQQCSLALVHRPQPS